MKRHDVDVLVIGAGFGGSLSALVLSQIGCRVAVVDRGSHPRFAIGESSTPAADFLLSQIADRWKLPQFRPLTAYGSWKQSHPELMCGLKRGFSYFHHQPESGFGDRPVIENQLLVAASADDSHSDTHWLRSDVDAFFAAQLIDYNVEYLEHTTLTGQLEDDRWSWSGTQQDESVEVRCDFVIDASGAQGVIAKTLGIAEHREFLTNSSAIFGHFDELPRWRSFVRETAIHPFDCDAAAVHHILEEGWLWQLRFDSEVTSCGLVFDGSTEEPKPGGNAALVDKGLNPEDRFFQIVSRYPELARQFQDARVVAPSDGLVATSRLQRLWGRTAGTGWLMLPSTAGFIDPMHSTGIAHTLAGVCRVGHLFEEHWNRDDNRNHERWAAGAERYDESLKREFSIIDRLVAGVYRSRSQFSAMVDFLMLYFAAATTWESRCLQSDDPGGPLWLSDDEHFLTVVDAALAQIQNIESFPADNNKSFDPRSFSAWIRNNVHPYNSAGLCDPGSGNMYRYTAAPTKAED